MILFALACIITAWVCFRDPRIKSQKIPTALAAVGVLTLVFAAMGGGQMLTHPKIAKTPVQQGLVLGFSWFGAVWNTLIVTLIGGLTWLIWLARRKRAKVTHLGAGFLVGALIVLASPLTGLISDGWNTHGKQLAMIPGAPADASGVFASGLLHGSGMFLLLGLALGVVGISMAAAASKSKSRGRARPADEDTPRRRRPAPRRRAA